MNRLRPLFFIVIFWTACKQETTPKGIISKEQMAGLLTDIHLVDGYTNVATGDTLNKFGSELYSSVFKKYHTDSAGLSRSMHYYTALPGHLLTIYEQVKKNLDAIDKAEKKRVAKEAAKKTL